MTPAEIDAEIQNLREQVLQLQQQQDAQKSIGFGADSSQYPSALRWKL
jgi:hypothetical protein